MAFVSNSITYTQVAIPFQNGMETMGIKIDDVHIVNVYNPPNNDLDTTVLNQMVRQRKIIICGDFKSHHGMWGSLSMDAIGRTLVSFIESNENVVLNTSTPTHFYAVGAGLWIILDLSIV